MRTCVRCACIVRASCVRRACVVRASYVRCASCVRASCVRASCVLASCVRAFVRAPSACVGTYGNLWELRAWELMVTYEKLHAWDLRA